MVLLVGDKGATLVLLLVLSSIVVALPKIEIVEASGTIYILSDGNVEGTDKILRDGTVYTFTDNIFDSLVVERDNIVVDGAGYSIEGPHTGQAQSSEGIGILVDSRSNVTISNVAIQHFLYGICINRSSNNRITNSNIASNNIGIMVEHSSENRIHENQISNNIDVGIYVFESSDTSFSENIIVDNANDGISLFFTSITLNEIALSNINNCSIRDNGVGIRIINSLNTSITPLFIDCNITNNQVGIHLEASSVSIQFNNLANNGVGIQLAGSDNCISRNNFINNTKQVYDIAWDSLGLSPSVNTWYSGDAGNYWSDYDGTDNNDDDIGDTPYVIDENNQDPLPKNTPFRFPNQPFPINTQEDFTISNIIWSIIIIVIAVVLVVYFGKVRNTGKIKK